VSVPIIYSNEPYPPKAVEKFKMLLVMIKNRRK